MSATNLPVQPATKEASEPAEALRLLFEEELPAVSIVEQADVEARATSYEKWGGRGFESGPREAVQPLLLRYLKYLAADPLRKGFRYFEVKRDTVNGLPCVWLKAWFESFVTRIPIWRTATGVVVPRTGDFPRLPRP
jgi:hypothetical protein